MVSKFNTPVNTFRSGSGDQQCKSGVISCRLRWLTQPGKCKMMNSCHHEKIFHSMIPIFLIWIAGKHLLLASGGEHPDVNQICILLLDAPKPHVSVVGSFSCKCNQDLTADAKTCKSHVESLRFPAFDSAASATTITSVAVFPARSLGDGPSVSG